MSALVLSCGRTGTNMLLEIMRGSTQLRATHIAEHVQDPLARRIGLQPLPVHAVIIKPPRFLPAFHGHLESHAILLNRQEINLRAMSLLNVGIQPFYLTPLAVVLEEPSVPVPGAALVALTPLVPRLPLLPPLPLPPRHPVAAVSKQVRLCDLQELASPRALGSLSPAPGGAGVSAARRGRLPIARQRARPWARPIPLGPASYSYSYSYYYYCYYYYYDYDDYYDYYCGD